MESPLAYIPTDRRHALAAGVDLPRRTTGAALFADISGFTPLSEALVAALGPGRGAEELSLQLNLIYDALIAEADRYRGSVIAFSGDAITCWFDESGDGGWTPRIAAVRPTPPTPVQRATACAMAMQAAMQQFATIAVPNAPAVALAVKVAVATGPVVRFLVGDPGIQIIDAIAGATLERLAAGEHLAARGEVVLDAAAASALGEPGNIIEWRSDAASGDRFAVVASVSAAVAPDPWPALATDALTDDDIRPWLLPPVASRLGAGMGEFLTELRPAVSLFLHFGGIDYDDDPDAGPKLDEFVSAAQATLNRFESCLLQLTIGDKGSYINAAFGAPIAHEDDAVRAVTAALELRDHRSASVGEIQIGVGQGRLRTGAYGGVTRRTYGVLGDEVNLAARLMQHAPTSGVLVDQPVRKATLDAFVWEDVEPFHVKGKSQPILASKLVAARDRRTTHLAEPSYALPMVGRQSELAAILSTLDLVVGGAGHVVGVSAEAGMGKSRLVAEVIRQARRRAIVGYGGECQSYGVNAGYLVWQNIWRGFFGLDPTMSNAEQIGLLARQLAAVDPVLVDRLPLLGAVINIPIPDTELTASFDSKLRKESLESLLVDCLSARAREHPILLVLEDCHWLDPLSHDLLDAVARAIASLPVMVVLAHRPMYAPRLMAPRVSALAYYVEVPLTELPDEAIARLVRAKLHQLYGEAATPSDGLIVELSQRAQGNPFYIEELLNYLKDQGLDPQHPDALLRLQFPDSLYGLILGRIDKLAEDQRTVLKVASVIGRLFEVAMLWGVYRPFADHDGLRRDLATLVELELTALDRPEPELTYFFKHVLTQEVAYGTLSFATRATLHDQIGRYIESRYPDFGEQHLDLLAHHFDHSDNLVKRREYLCKAGKAAQASFANSSAVDYYARALPLLDGAERVELLLDLGQVQDLLGEWAAAEACHREALVIATQLDDLSGRARSEHALGVLDRKRGRYADATAWLTAAQASFAALGDAGGMSHVLADIGEVQRLQGHFETARALYDESLAVADRVADAELRLAARAHALKGAGTVATWQGDYEAARSLNAESLTIRRELGDTPGVAVLLNNQGIVARFLHDLGAARRLNDESLALFRELGDRWSLGQLLNNQACVAADQHDYAEARALLQESLAIRRQLGDRAGLALSLNTLADVLIDEGDHDGAVPLLDESLAINRELGNRSAIAYLLEDYAGVAAAQDRPARALRLAGFAAARRELLGAPLPPAERERVERMVAAARSAVAESTAAELWEEGRRLGLDDAVDAVLAAS
jgi:adenylate cyclase